MRSRGVLNTPKSPSLFRKVAYLTTFVLVHLAALAVAGWLGRRAFRWLLSRRPGR